VADFLDELQEEMREEKYAKLWKAYGPFVFLGVFFVLLGTGLYVGWKSYRDHVYQFEGTHYQQALDLLKAGKRTEALALFKQLEATSEGYGFLAQLRQLALQADAFLKAPSEEYLKLVKQEVEAVMKNRKTDGALTGLLTTHLCLLELQTSLSDSSLQQRLERLITPHNPWKGLGLEITLLQALQQQDVQRAETVLSTLMASRDVSSSLQTRVGLEMMGAGLGVPVFRGQKR
jgi:hypothetical protein